MTKKNIILLVTLLFFVSCGTKSYTLGPDGYKKTNCKVKKKR